MALGEHDMPVGVVVCGHLTGALRGETVLPEDDRIHRGCRPPLANRDQPRRRRREEQDRKGHGHRHHGGQSPTAALHGFGTARHAKDTEEQGRTAGLYADAPLALQPAFEPHCRA